MGILETNDAFWLAYEKMVELRIYYGADSIKVKPIECEDMVLFSIMKNNNPIAEMLWDKEESLPDKPAFYNWEVQKRMIERKRARE